MGARPDVRLSWSFLHALAQEWSSRPGTHEVVDEADDLVPALAHMCIRAFASEVRHSVPLREQRFKIAGELTERDGGTRELALRDVANKVVHGSPEAVVVREDGDVRLHFVNSDMESSRQDWIAMWFSASELIDVLHRVLNVKPHDSPSRDESVRGFIVGLGADKFLPTGVEDTEGHLPLD
jgi:hypothetical protein